MLLSLIIFLLILSILVLIHELGHFFVAKKLGIKVEEFGFGFPPKALCIKRGETVYSINWLPIGGFVKLYGEDDAGGGKIQVKAQSSKVKVKDEARAFYTKTPWQRAAVVVAGVVMNALLAALIFYVYFFISGFTTNLPLIGNHEFLFVKQVNKNINDTDSVVSIIAKNSPVEKVGMETPSEIIAVNGKSITNRLAFIETVNKNKGKQIEVTWKNLQNGQLKSARLTPRVSPPKNEGALGIGFFPIVFLHYETPLQKLLSGIVHPINLMSYNFDVLGKLISISVQQKTAEPVSQGVSGPVGIFSLVNNILEIQSIKEKTLQVLNLAGILSISLAFFNILPIPALDGGRLFFILVEAVTGRKINQKVEGTIHTIGMVVLLTLILLITLKDIGQLFSFSLPFLK